MKISQDVQHFIAQVQNEIEAIVKDNFIGTYIHGSLALGGFNEASSDIDILVVTKDALHFTDKQRLTELFLTISNAPHPLEISFLHRAQLEAWQHPCPYDYHYSEYWLPFYRDATTEQLENLFANENKTDRDLAAHITIINTNGISYKGEPIANVFPAVPKSDYIDSILGDFEDCIDTLYANPIYSVLNMLRVYLVGKENLITSKLEAGRWGVENLPGPLHDTVQLALTMYEGNETEALFSNDELSSFKQWVLIQIESLPIMEDFKG